MAYLGTEGDPMTVHRDRYHTDIFMDRYGKFIDRLDSPERLAYFAERPQYDEGRDNGYVLTTREHEDGECDLWKPGPLQRADIR